MKVQDETSTLRRIKTAPEHYRSTVGDLAQEARFAYVIGARSVREVEAYLPGNYALMESFTGTLFGRERLVVVIGGNDSAGWTLDGYVIPRLRSGNIACSEINGEEVAA